MTKKVSVYTDKNDNFILKIGWKVCGYAYHVDKGIFGVVLGWRPCDPGITTDKYVKGAAAAVAYLEAHAEKAKNRRDFFDSRKDW